MTDPIMWTALSLFALAGLMIVSVAGLKAWRDWLALQRLALQEGRRPGAEPTGAGLPGPAARIELADLKERVRKLEAIAAGVDL